MKHKKVMVRLVVLCIFLTPLYIKSQCIKSDYIKLTELVDKKENITYIVDSNIVKKLEDGCWKVAYKQDTNSIFAQFKTVNGMLHGNYTAFYLDGTLCLKGKFVNGKQEGNWVTFHLNSEFYSLLHYKDGLQDGDCFMANLKGKVTHKLTFRNGVLFGSKKYCFLFRKKLEKLKPEVWDVI